MHQAVNYSVDMLKRAAFTDELNKLRIQQQSPPDPKTNDNTAVIIYLEQRLKEIALLHGK